MAKRKSPSRLWMDFAFRTVSIFGRGLRDACFGRGTEPARKRPPHRTPGPPEWCRVLGVPPTATVGEIKKAYRSLMQRHHPDKAAHLSAEEQRFAEEETKRLNDAYEMALRPR